MIGTCELTAEMLARKLEQGGVIPAGAGRVPEPGGDRPWFVALVLGSAGWVAGLCVLTYRKKVTDVDTGEVLREADHQLSEHTGHGSDKPGRRLA